MLLRPHLVKRLCTCFFLSVIDRNVFEMNEKNFSHFGQSVKKYRLMNTVTISFNTIVRQMTEMSQQKLSKMSQRKKTVVLVFYKQRILLKKTLISPKQYISIGPV